MRRRRLLLGLLAAAAIGTAAAAGGLPRLADLRPLAAPIRQSGEPLIVLFTTPGCPHCEQVRSHYLAPRLAAGALVREVDISSRARLVDAQGRATTEAEFARGLGVRAVPAVLLLDARGEPLADALLGSDTAGFYEGYLEARLAQARRQLGATRP
ncbi:MAG: thioredoxin fold domain-containing protein [Burkholderiaceae bacterium]